MLKYLLLLVIFVGLYLAVRTNLNDIRHAVDSRLSGSTRLEDASRLYVELQQFELTAHRFVEGDPDVSQSDLQTSFDLLWSRVQSLSHPSDYAIVQDIDSGDILLARARSALELADPVVGALSRKDTKSLAKLESLFAEVNPLVSAFSQSAYQERLARSVEAAENQRVSTKKVDALQAAFLGIGILIPIFLLAEVLRIRRLNRKIRMREEEIRQLGMTDALTGLGNRRSFMETLEIKSPDRGIRENSMLLIDLDGFKQVNDNFGHPAGDELLRQVAARLSSTAATAVSIARLGGDEFALIVPHSKQDAALLALELIEALGSPYLIAGKLIHVTASIGVNAFMPGDHPGAATLLGDADVALYEAKASGRGCFCYFEETLKEKRMLRMRIEESLAHAIEADQISVKFHPQIDVRTGRVAGVEALARWVHPELGSIPVEDFIRIAEQKGLIKSLDFYILETACREVRVLAKAGVDLRLSVNVSPVEAGRAGYASEVLAIVDKLKFPHDRLTLELTENTVMEDFEAVATNLEILDAAGIRIAIDDFGSGYSNLSYLARFPFSYLKVDRRLAEKIENSEKDRIVLTNIARLARGLDLGVVMEGIETAEQLAFIQSIDIPEAQGFLFAQPLGDVELIPFLSAFSMKARPQKRRQFAA